MKNEQTHRYAGLLGVAGSAIALVGTLVMLPGDFMEPADELTRTILDDSSRIIAGAQLAVIGFVLLAAFGAVVHRRLSFRGAPGLAVAAATGYGTAATLGLIGATGTAALALRADEDGGIAAEAAVATFDLTSMLVGTAAPVALALAVGATGLAGLQAGVIPRWLAYVAMPIAVASLILPISWAAAPFALLWTAIVGATFTASTSVAAIEPDPVLV